VPVADAPELRLRFRILLWPAPLEEHVRVSRAAAETHQLAVNPLQPEAHADVIRIVRHLVARPVLFLVDHAGDDRHRRAGHERIQVVVERAPTLAVLKDRERATRPPDVQFVQDHLVVPEVLELEP
jgi:hypothetical protein